MIRKSAFRVEMIACPDRCADTGAETNHAHCEGEAGLPLPSPREQPPVPTGESCSAKSYVKVV